MPDPVIVVEPLAPEIVIPKLRDDSKALAIKQAQWEAEAERKAYEQAAEALVEVGRLPAREELGKLAYLALGKALQQVITGQIPIKSAQQAAAIINAAGTLLRHEEERTGQVDVGSREDRMEEARELMAVVAARRAEMDVPITP